ncbi:MAG: tetratricopeptide repeat protein, partial [Candidatus Saccharibacteria bacterium]|nr:tetratricopeptide repeat protein [Candidatus Saccharibacteria bacterium]
MFNVIPIAVIAGYLAFLFPLKKEKVAEEKDPKFEVQMKKLWQVAQSSMREKKPVRAEKALLTILKFDEKNAAAYNRLGILYAKDRKYDEAIECFEIAESLDNNASSLHNVGLIYLETGAYEKAVMALKQAIQLEGDVATRYIALAKAEEKLGNRKNALENLEMAYELDHSTATLRQILAIHENAGDAEKIAETTARIERQIAEDARIRENRQRERRTVARHRSPVRMVSRTVRARTRSAGVASSGSAERVKNHEASRLRIARAVGAASVAEVENESSRQRKSVVARSSGSESGRGGQRVA